MKKSKIFCFIAGILALGALPINAITDLVIPFEYYTTDENVDVTMKVWHYGNKDKKRIKNQEKYYTRIVPLRSEPSYSKAYDIKFRAGGAGTRNLYASVEFRLYDNQSTEDQYVGSFVLGIGYHDSSRSGGQDRACDGARANARICATDYYSGSPTIQEDIFIWYNPGYTGVRSEATIAKLAFYPNKSYHGNLNFSFVEDRGVNSKQAICIGYKTAKLPYDHDAIARDEQ